MNWTSAKTLTWCVAKHFLLTQMPEFDLYFLPGSVSVEGTSMLDDNIAFSLMALNMSALSPQPPLKVILSYLLPYASYHEQRVNWRPLFFAKYAEASEGVTSSRGVIDALISNDISMMNWTKYNRTGRGNPTNKYFLGPFASGSAPPVIGVFDFTAYGYGSCTAWATFLSSALKAVGVPARQVGSPCWNTGNFSGSALLNPNVSHCWSGGRPGGPSGGPYLNNHNWVEYWDNVAGFWRFLDVATTSSAENTWFCGQYDRGCECSSNAGKAERDHEILAVTWSPVGGSEEYDGGEVLNMADLQLSTGESVSPLVWSPKLQSPLGHALKNVGLRSVNRTGYYRCKTTKVPELKYV